MSQTIFWPTYFVSSIFQQHECLHDIKIWSFVMTSLFHKSFSSRLDAKPYNFCMMSGSRSGYKFWTLANECCEWEHMRSFGKVVAEKRNYSKRSVTEQLRCCSQQWWLTILVIFIDCHWVVLFVPYTVFNKVVPSIYHPSSPEKCYKSPLFIHSHFLLACIKFSFILRAG